MMLSDWAPLPVDVEPSWEWGLAEVLALLGFVGTILVSGVAIGVTVWVARWTRRQEAAREEEDVKLQGLRDDEEVRRQSQRDVDADTRQRQRDADAEQRQLERDAADLAWRTERAREDRERELRALVQRSHEDARKIVWTFEPDPEDPSEGQFRIENLGEAPIRNVSIISGWMPWETAAGTWSPEVEDDAGTPLIRPGEAWVVRGRWTGREARTAWLRHAYPELQWVDSASIPWETDGGEGAVIHLSRFRGNYARMRNQRGEWAVAHLPHPDDYVGPEQRGTDQSMW